MISQMLVRQHFKTPKNCIQSLKLIATNTSEKFHLKVLLNQIHFVIRLHFVFVFFFFVLSFLVRITVIVQI